MTWALPKPVIITMLKGSEPVIRITDGESSIIMSRERHTQVVAHPERLLSLLGSESRGNNRREYLRDPAEIGRKSRTLVIESSDLTNIPDDLVEVALRLVQACGMPDILEDLVYSPGAGAAGRSALREGACVLVDTEMVASGIIRRLLPAANKVVCKLNTPGVAERARALKMTRAAAATELWCDELDSAIVAIGNAPTALYRLLELLEAGAPTPALIIAMPVGFVGAVEAKESLTEKSYGVPYLALRGRRGGSALAAAAVNALASGTGE